MKKILAGLLSALIIFSSLPGKAFAANPSLSVSIQSANYTPSLTYANNTTTATGGKVYFKVLITNNESGTSANNVKLHVELPTNGQNNHSIVATVQADNASTVTANNNVSITNSAGILSYISGSTVLDWATGTVGTYTNEVITPYDTQTSGYLVFDSSPLLDGSSHTIQLVFQTNVVEKAISGSTTSGGGSAGGPCSDTKPQNISLTSVTRVSPTSVKLNWTKGDATSFQVKYGVVSNQYIYGTTTSGTELTVNALDPNAKYFFAVTPLKGCNPGALSNEGSVDPVGVINTANVGVGNLVQGVSSNIKSDITKAPAESTGTINPYATAKPTIKDSKEASKSATNSATPKATTSPINIPLTAGAKVMIGLGILALLGAAGLVMRSSTPTQSVKRGRGRPRKSR